MLYLKHPIAGICCILLFFYSCNEESGINMEGEQQEEQEEDDFLDIELIGDDTLFIDFVKESFILADRITDYFRTRELNEKLKDKTISENELSELSELLGFANWNAVEQYAQSRYETYEVLQTKYNITSSDTELLVDKSILLFETLFFGTDVSASLAKQNNFNCNREEDVAICEEWINDCIQSQLEEEWGSHIEIKPFCFPPVEDGEECYTTPSDLGSFYIEKSYQAKDCGAYYYCCLAEFGDCEEVDELVELCDLNPGVSFNF